VILGKKTQIELKEDLTELSYMGHVRQLGKLLLA